jgi:reverse gyrase
MYTSGCPNHQNRCWYRIGRPPASASNTWASKCRSAKSMATAAVSTGKATSTRKLVTTMFQVKTGMRNTVMPGARIVKTVVTMLTAVKMPEKPVRAMPRNHSSPPMLGVYVPSLSGA